MKQIFALFVFLFFAILGELIGVLSLHAEDVPFRNQRREVFSVCPVDTNTIVFLGNSITNFGAWPEFFGSDVKVVNRGISGNYSGEVYEHLDLILAGQPKMIFLMIGINDNNQTSIIIPNITNIIDKVKTESPRTKLYVQSLLPCNRTDRNGMVEIINPQLQTLCAEQGVPYLDIYSSVVNNATTPPGIATTYTNDNLHVTAAGYREWAKIVAPYVGAAQVFSTASEQTNSALVAFENIMYSQYAMLPVNDGDVLMLGDYNVMTGEWAELIKQVQGIEAPQVKNRGIGIGWGYTLTLPKLISIIPTIVKGNPAKVFVECGMKDALSGTAVSTATDYYKQIISLIRHAAPDADIYMQSLIPDATSSNNAAYIKPYNEAIQNAVKSSDSDKVHFVDLYDVLQSDDILSSRYQSANTTQSKGINGEGYLRWARLIAPIITMTDEEREQVNEIESHLMPRPKTLNLLSADNVSAEVAIRVNRVTDDELGLFNHNVPGFPNEGYKLNITTDGITITCADTVGEIRARQTLCQLLTNDSYPSVYIEDYPAFKVRGYMHDVGRSFISVDELKREIDLLSRFKINVFYWHLTDHHAFRFESKLHPQVNTHFTSTRWPNQYYSQDDCRELSHYAAERGMVIIPEIDMPGHSTSFTNAMGYKMSSTQGKATLKDILSELVEVFAESPYIHIGGDETSEATRDFVNEMGDYVRGLGKKVVCWNRYSESPRTLVDTGMNVDMVTNWASNGTLISGLPNIDMRYNYVNHFDVFADVAGIYRSTVFGVERGTDDVAGAITGIWNDRLVDSEEQIIAQNNLYAVALATGERAWQGGGKQYIEQGGAYIPNEGEEYDDFADWEDRFLYYKDKWLSNEPIPYVKQTNVRWNISQPFANNGDGTANFAEIEGASDLTTITTAATVTGAGIWLNHIWGTVIRGALGMGVGSPTNQTRYAWTYVYSETEQTVGAQIEFYNYSRSDNGKVQQNGKWDLMGSQVWLNDEELLPTWQWTNAGQTVSNTETPLGNVNFPARQPLQVQLKAGWNKVLLKLPWVNAGQQRTAKWQYTFVFTTLDGKKEIEGLVYSPLRILNHDEELLREQIAEVRTQMEARCKNKLGYYNPSIALSLYNTLAEVETALTRTPVDYSALSAQVSEAYDTFLALLTDDNLVQPTENILYTLSTPLRAGYYVTSNVVGSQMISSTSLTENSIWKFINRGDGTWNIQNHANNSYITPNTTSDSPISSLAAVPSTGWTLRAANTLGYLIITSGENVELNQTNAPQAYKLYNWGVNSIAGQTFNTTDTGCQFSIQVYTEHEPGGQQIEILPATGSLINSKNVTGGTWNNRWISTQVSPQFTLYCIENNIQNNGGYLDLRNGSNVNSRDFTLSCTEGYKITGMTATIHNATSGNNQTLNIEGKSFTSTDTDQDIDVSLDASTVTLNITGTNKGILMKNWVVTYDLLTEIEGFERLERFERFEGFNLAGQRVGDDYKGIIIVNGKKILK